jgi:hypothetical protein
LVIRITASGEVITLSLRALFTECLDPPKADRFQATPIVLVRGTEGSAREAELWGLRGPFVNGRPRAFVEVGEVPEGARPYEVADLIAFKLADHAAGFGRLRFPRLLLGLLALEVPLGRPAVDPGKREELLARTLTPSQRERVQRWRKRTEAVAGILARTAGAPISEDPIREAVGDLTPSSRRWYVAGGPVCGGTPRATGRSPEKRTFAGCTPSRQWCAGRPQEDPRARDDIDLTLCKAFVADLREEWHRASRWAESMVNGLVVIDRGDVDPFDAFLQVIAMVDRSEAPLVVVAGMQYRTELREVLPLPTPSRDAVESSLAYFFDFPAGG